MKTIWITIASIFVASTAGANGVANQLLIDNIRVDASGKGVVTFTEPLTDSPPCAIDKDTKMAFDLNTEGGKGFYAMLLSAQATGKKTYVRGKGACDIYSSIESISLGRILFLPDE